MAGKGQSGYNCSLFVHTAVKFNESAVVGFVLFVRLFISRRCQCLRLYSVEWWHHKWMGKDVV